MITTRDTQQIPKIIEMIIQAFLIHTFPKHCDEEER